MRGRQSNARGGIGRGKSSEASPNSPRCTTNKSEIEWMKCRTKSWPPGSEPFTDIVAQTASMGPIESLVVVNVGIYHLLFFTGHII